MSDNHLVDREFCNMIHQLARRKYQEGDISKPD